MGILKSVKVAVSNVFNTTPTGGKITAQNINQPKVEKSSVTNLKQAVSAAAIAVPITKAAELPAVVAKVATVAKGAAAAIGGSIKNVVSKNPVTSAAVGTVAAGAVVSNPTLLKSAANTPEALFNVGYNVGEFSKDPSISTAKTIIQENPIIVGGALTAAAIVGGSAIAKTGAAIASTAAINDLTSTVKDMTPAAALPKDSDIAGAIIPSGTGAQYQPITPETQIIGKSAGSRAVSRRKGKVKQSNTPIQRTTVNIINQSQYKKFIY